MKKIVKKPVAKTPVKKTVAKKPMMKVGGAKKPLRKYQREGEVKTAGQAYMKYVPGATASDTLGTDDTRYRYPGYAEDTSNWPAKNKMLDMTYGESPIIERERVPQSPAAVKAYANELKKTYKKQKKGGVATAKYKKGGTVKPVVKKKTIVKSKKK